MSQSIVDRIIQSWLTTENGKGQDLSDEVGAPSYVIRGVHQECIVAIPVSSETVVNEEFSAVKLYTARKAIAGEEQYLLMLVYPGAVPPRAYSALCAEFLYPGARGENRKELVDDPIAWWRSWKELLGNESVDLRVYDILGELCVLRLLAKKSPGTKYDWHGPEGSSFDIHSPADLYEVKSTIVKGDKRVVIHNAFQLDARGVPLHLMHCVFEASAAGESINDLLEQLKLLGALDLDLAEGYLRALGFAKGRSVRDRKYLLLEVNQYEVDSRFPIIAPMPVGVVDLEYTIELGAFDYKKVF